MSAADMETVSSAAEPKRMKREEFRKYLESSGVMDIMTQALSNLYTESEVPEDPLDYIRTFMLEHKRPEGVASKLRAELRDTQGLLEKALKQIEELSGRLAKYEKVEPEGSTVEDGKE